MTTTPDGIEREPSEEALLIQQISTENCELMAECRRLIGENSQYQALLRNASEAIVGLSPNGIVQSFNHAAEKVFGLRERDLLGRSLEQLVPCPSHGGNVGLFLKDYCQQHEGSSSPPPITGHRWDGARVYLRCAFGEVHSNAEPWASPDEPEISEFALCMFRNVTEEVELEQRLREKGRQLERSIHQLKRSNEAKDEFLANMSHELRTPLHGILSFARFGLKKWESADREKLSSYFQTIETSGRSLLVLVNDLLDLAKLESGKLSFEMRSVDLGDCVDQVLSEMAHLLRENELTLSWDRGDADLQVLGDESRLVQVIRNVLSNAIRYSPQAGEIRVEAASDQGLARLTVRDTGPGIPNDELESVFEKFVQSSTTKSGAGGTGLGLPICRQILNTHSGRIWVEPSVEGGVISFEIPTRRHFKALLSRNSPPTE